MSPSMIHDRRDDMTLAELVEELELSYPEKVAGFERRYPDAMAAVAGDDIAACDPDELDELASDLRASSASDAARTRFRRSWTGIGGMVDVASMPGAPQ